MLNSLGLQRIVIIFIAIFEQMNASIFLAHLKLRHELRKDTKEGLSVCCFSVFSEVRGSFAEFFHSSLLQGLQRLDCWMAVFQEVLHILESRDTKAS